jgi:hypothetical protein
VYGGGLYRIVRVEEEQQDTDGELARLLYASDDDPEIMPEGDPGGWHMVDGWLRNTTIRHPKLTSTNSV